MAFLLPALLASDSQNLSAGILGGLRSDSFVVWAASRWPDPQSGTGQAEGVAGG